MPAPACPPAVVVRPAAHVRLASCRGSVTVTGSGTARRPAVVTGGRIDGTGGAALVLRDAPHVVVRDLELTNTGPEGRRAGIRVVATRGVLNDVTVRRLWIHDVSGDLSKGVGGSSGISLEATGNARFALLRVLGNRVARVSRTGISLVGAQDKARPDADRPWPAASTGVRIARNRVDRVGGDGIVVRGSVRAVVRSNVVSRGNQRGSPLFGPTPVCNAGIWTFHANRTVIERNEVFGMESHDCDGTGFDVDYDQDRTIVQANYSHDNEGGFILLCADDDPYHRADVRFNLSLDDASTLNTVPCAATEGRVGNLSGIRVFHNTVVAERPRLVAEQFELPLLIGGGSLVFANNIVVATQEQTAPFPCGEHCTHNLFAGMPPAGDAAIAGDPQFVNRGRRAPSGFRVRRGSPAIGAAAPIADAGTRDYFGDPLGPTVGFATGPPA